MESRELPKRYCPWLSRWYPTSHPNARMLLKGTSMPARFISALGCVGGSVSLHEMHGPGNDDIIPSWILLSDLNIFLSTLGGKNKEKFAIFAAIFMVVDTKQFGAQWQIFLYFQVISLKVDFFFFLYMSCLRSEIIPNTELWIPF